MRAAVLFSGGKDSTYATWWALNQGFTVSHLVSVFPKNPDSYMYHSVNIGLAKKLAECMGKTLVECRTEGKKEKEVSDLSKTLSGLNINAVVSGALASDYQKNRIDNICEKLGLVSYAPCWRKKPLWLLRELLDNGFEIIVTAVAAEGLGEKWLGRRIDEKTFKKLVLLEKKHSISPVGEGGEFETLVLDAPFFRKKLKILKAEKVFSLNSGKYLVEKTLLLDKKRFVEL